MSLVQLDNVSLSYGTWPLLDKANLSIERGERLCLIGRNGTGKSSLMSLLTRQADADDGAVILSKSIRIGYLEQALPVAENLTVYDYLSTAFVKHVDLLQQYHHLSAELINYVDEKKLAELNKLQTQMEFEGVWQLNQRLDNIISRTQLPANSLMSELSGGNRRLAALAKSLVIEPDLLLLDEPTNHLDIKRIEWLEQSLPHLVETILFVTHDRRFADAVATRIIELDRGQIRSYPGNFSAYYKMREQEESIEEKSKHEFNKKLAQEERWVRQGIKARRTRNEGRVRALKTLREEKSQQRDVQGKTNITVVKSEGSGKVVAKLHQVCKAYGDKILLDSFSFKLIKGDRIAILGDNGSGKSTLIKLLIEELQPDAGTIKLGTNLELAYFDQNKLSIDPNLTVFDNIADGNEYIQLGNKSRHVIGYLQEFLFAPERVRSPASSLSGGELSRLLLAKVFAKPSNLLILDEPTNDLDMETLEVLESTLLAYSGTVLLISHDRTFIDNTVTHVIHLDGNGNTTTMVGSYSDWYAYQQRAKDQTQARDIENVSTVVKEQVIVKKRKLSYNEQRELDLLPEQIDALEQQLKKQHMATQAADFYNQEQAVIKEVFNTISQLENDIEVAFTRWETLSDQA